MQFVDTSRFTVRDASSLSIPGQNIKDIRIDPRNRIEYIAKRPSRAGRVEAITESLLNSIGERLGVQMARHKLGICEGELWFMSQNFLRSDEALIHGIEFLNQFHAPGHADKLKKRSAEEKSFYSIKSVLEGFKVQYGHDADKFVDPFAKMLFMDAIVGCQDRHSKNWGIIRSVRTNRKDCYAPVFDTARALFWNFASTDKLKVMTSVEMKAYVRRSSPPIGDFEGKRVDHFGLVKQILKEVPDTQETLSRMTASVRESSIRRLVDNEYSAHLPKARRQKILECLGLRFARLRKMLDEEVSK